MAKLTRTVNYCNYRWEEYVLTEEELALWKTGDEDAQEEIIDNADWDLVRDKPIDDYGGEDDPEVMDFLEQTDKQGPWDEKYDKSFTVGGLSNDKKGDFMKFQKKQNNNLKK